MIQITENRIRVIENDKVVSEWQDPDQKPITLCSVNQTQLVCAIQADLIYFEVDQAAKIDLKARITMDNEIACIDVSPLVDSRSRFCAVGNWGDISVSFPK